jgi:hypothetical protein
MGWLFTHKPHGMSVKDFFEENFNYNRDGRYGRILDCAVVKRTAYIAYEAGSDDGNRSVFGVVCLLDYRPKECHNFGYKDMDETMGPYFYDCPERILKLLTPTENEYALEWREKCWERIRSQQNKPKLKKGLLIEFAHPIKFASGVEVKLFRVVDPRKLLFEGPYGRLYKLNRSILKDQDWAAVST